MANPSLKAALAARKFIVAPGIFDGISARVADAMGFDCLYMTGFGTVETAIDAMKRGAYDYILKPFKVEEVVHIVQRGLDKQRLEAENLRLKEALVQSSQERGT